MNQDFFQQDKRVLIRHYPEASELTVTTPRKWKYHAKTVSQQLDQEEKTINSAVSRARSTVRRKCLAIAADRMLTLTMPGAAQLNTQPLDDAWRMFKNFLQRCRRAGVNFDYVAVPEKQGRGAWHFHVAIGTRLDANFCRQQWVAVGGGKQIDLKYFSDRDHSSKTEGCSAYISKYIGKEMESSEFGRNRYRCSKGIIIDIERQDIPKQFFANIEMIKETFQQYTGMQAGWINLYPQVTTVSSWGDGYRDMRINEGN